MATKTKSKPAPKRKKPAAKAATKKRTKKVEAAPALEADTGRPIRLTGEAEMAKRDDPLKNEARPEGVA